MRRLLLFSVAILMVAILSAPVVADKGGPSERPFNGKFSGVLLGFDTDSDRVAARCDNPKGKVAWAVTSFAGWGNATHMGKTYLYAEHCSYATGFMPDGTYGQGELTMVAANQDVLSATYSNGSSLPGEPVIGFMDYFTFDDAGTGRFNFASGGGVEMGYVNLADNTFTMRMKGVISYSRR